MNVLETCLIVNQDGRTSVVPTGRMLAEDTGTRHRRRRGYSLDMSTTDEITPHPPLVYLRSTPVNLSKSTFHSDFSLEHQLLYSASESKSSINTDTSSNDIPSNRSSYKFQCKNVSPNLHIIVKTDVNRIESEAYTSFPASSPKGTGLPLCSPSQLGSKCETCMEADDDDVTDRIIPEYYINHTGIKTGALTFDYYETILDSIRNLRTLNRHQMQFLKTISNDQLIQIVHTYNEMFDTYVKWLICDGDEDQKSDRDLNTNPYV